MNTTDKLKMMLLGPKKMKGKPDAKEEAKEKAMGMVDSPDEEALEDAKGRPIMLRKKVKK